MNARGETDTVIVMLGGLERYRKPNSPPVINSSRTGNLRPFSVGVVGGCLG